MSESGQSDRTTNEAADRIRGSLAILKGRAERGWQDDPKWVEQTTNEAAVVAEIRRQVRGDAHRITMTASTAPIIVKTYRVPASESRL